MFLIFSFLFCVITSSLNIPAPLKKALLIFSSHFRNSFFKTLVDRYSLFNCLETNNLLFFCFSPRLFSSGLKSYVLLFLGEKCCLTGRISVKIYYSIKKIADPKITFKPPENLKSTTAKKSWVFLTGG